MRDQTPAYDLGSAGTATAPDDSVSFRILPRRKRPKPRESATEKRSARREQLNLETRISGSLSLLLPGAGRILRGRLANGLFYLSSVALLFTMAWAINDTLSRIAGTAEILGYPRALGVWTLGGLFLAIAILHVINVTRSVPHGAAPQTTHPIVAGIASGLIPGWGQMLNGTARRAALFVGGLWLTGAAWLLVAPSTQELFRSYSLYLPSWMLIFSSATVRWTLPAVIWSLAIYDAVTRAQANRGQGSIRD